MGVTQKNRSFRSGRRLRQVRLLLVLALVWAAPAAIAESDADDDLFQAFSPLSDEVLAGLRGGFVTRDGVEIDIGIERLVFINNTLESAFAMDLSQIGRRGQMGERASPRMQSLVDSGMINIIQNALDGQKISNVTALDITVKNLRNFDIPEFGRSIEVEMSRSLDSF